MNPDIKFLIAQAMAGYDQLPLTERARLLRGVAAVCPPQSEEAETATQIVFHIERLEQEQLHFRDRLFPKK